MTKTIGIIGHIDHGKTSLTAALLRVLAKENNMTDEQKRVLTESDKKMLEIGREAGIADSASLRIIDTMKGKYALTDVKPEVKTNQMRVQPKEQGDAKVAEASQKK